jgi:hypothetical protein
MSILCCEGYVEFLDGVGLQFGISTDESDEVVGHIVGNEVASDRHDTQDGVHVPPFGWCIPINKINICSFSFPAHQALFSLVAYFSVTMHSLATNSGRNCTSEMRRKLSSSRTRMRMFVSLTRE